MAKKKKKISYDEAWELYMENDWYEIYPFDETIEENFIDVLLESGYTITDYDADNRRYR